MVNLVQIIGVDRFSGSTYSEIGHPSTRSPIGAAKSLIRSFRDKKSNPELIMQIAEEAGYEALPEYKPDANNPVMVYQRGNTLLGFGKDGYRSMIPIETTTTEETKQRDLESLVEDAEALGIHSNRNIQKYLLLQMAGGLAAIGMIVGPNAPEIFSVQEFIADLESLKSLTPYDIGKVVGGGIALAAVAAYTAGMLNVVEKIHNIYHRAANLLPFWKLPQATKERLERYTIGLPVVKSLVGEAGYRLEPKKGFGLPYFHLNPSPAH